MKQEIVHSWIKRADELLKLQGNDISSQAYQFSTSLVAAFYGVNSVQLRALKDFADSVHTGAAHHTTKQSTLLTYCYGVIKNTKAEIENGLVANVRAQIQGEVLGDLVQQAKELLANKSDSAMNVAGVLAAAAFEDTLRRLGAEQAGIIGRPKLDQVILQLKEVNILKGGEIGTAVGYLKFRNDALHADWPQVHRVQVESCLLFVESLLLKHFS
jgi:predicted lipoprotein